MQHIEPDGYNQKMCPIHPHASVLKHTHFQLTTLKWKALRKYTSFKCIPNFISSDGSAFFQAEFHGSLFVFFSF